MRTYRKVVTERTVVDCLFCDKCGVEIKVNGYDGFESSFRFIEGSIFPEGNFTQTTKADFCQDCAEEIAELLKKNGVKIYRHETDTPEIIEVWREGL